MYRTFHEEVRIQVDKTILEGDLIIPPGAHAIVVFSHGSGSSRFSKRNQQVATYLRDMNFGTLLLDLLTPAEDNQYHNRFNIEIGYCPHEVSLHTLPECHLLNVPEPILRLHNESTFLFYNNCICHRM